MEQSPFKLMQALSSQLDSLLSRVDTPSLPVAVQKILSPMRQQLVDARLEVRDYDLAQTRAEQFAFARAGKDRLTTLHQTMLAASEHGIFGAADVAQLSARIQQIISLLT